MKIYPAIDIHEGKVVRLSQGDFARQTTYGDDPLAIAESFAAQGARYLHVIDLSGAKDPGLRQIELVTRIVRATALKVQTGGGIRRLDEVQRLLDAGVDRVILGSILVTDRAVSDAIFASVGADRLTLALDVRIDAAGRPMVATLAWEKMSLLTLSEVIAMYSDYPLSSVLCTDIGRDGTAAGPNFNLYQCLLESHPEVGWLASGGVAAAADVTRARDMGLEGIIIGKALYEGNFTLKEVLATC